MYEATLLEVFQGNITTISIGVFIVFVWSMLWPIWIEDEKGRRLPKSSLASTVFSLSNVALYLILVATPFLSLAVVNNLSSPTVSLMVELLTGSRFQSQVPFGVIIFMGLLYSFDLVKKVFERYATFLHDRIAGVRRANVFLNYRRSEASAIAGRLYDRLMKYFDPDEVFLDVDAIQPGMDFVKILEEKVSQCNVFIAVIDPNWAEAKDKNGKLRLQDPNDHVRIELEAALSRDIPVIPVLIDAAAMPEVETLPESLQPLARRHAVHLTHTRFAAEADSLAEVIAKLTGARRIG